MHDVVLMASSMAVFIPEGFLLHAEVSAVVELIESELSEVRGVHDGEAIVRNVAIDFWVCKEEGAMLGMCVVEAFKY